jgi:glutathione S-transferase
VVDTLDWWLRDHEYVCGARFTMADVYIGSQVDWGLQFGTLPDRASFKNYQASIRERAAYQAAKAIDMELIAAMQAENGG